MFHAENNFLPFEQTPLGSHEPRIWRTVVGTLITKGTHVYAYPTTRSSLSLSILCFSTVLDPVSDFVCHMEISREPSRSSSLCISPRLHGEDNAILECAIRCLRFDSYLSNLSSVGIDNFFLTDVTSFSTLAIAIRIPMKFVCERIYDF